MPLNTITPQYQLSHAFRNFEDELSHFVGTCIQFDTPEQALEEFTGIGKEFVPHLFELLEIIKENN